MDFSEFEFWDRRFQSLNYNINRRFDALEALIKKQTEEIKKMSESQSDLDSQIAVLVTDVQAVSAASVANTAAIQALLAKIAASGNTDFSTEVSNLQTADQAVKDAVSAIAASDTSAS